MTNTNKISRRKAIGLIGGLAAIAFSGCENSPVRDIEKENKEFRKRENYLLTQGINQMVVFNHSSKTKHRMLYNEFLEVTGMKRELPAEYDNLPVRIDIYNLIRNEQELSKNDNGEIDLVHFRLTEASASDAYNKLAKFYSE